ncbi:hypothetical protein CONCODRAFT_78935 [Conidiobolus coronatus NRRL 28638]|uniref:Uncharacterized protein n=1 Tax=Conidiobolus coronatus (strain ATCC 28846 / CBS 209.66 / NRRL 28638) TaxID=796925 RepID=A0A137P5G6_CONC2|nr:hypothetical protein CONCODRAFT_78935 [Conidiobolus coronatus NRRL 28638]|eukprot:KXN70262.1 hypothetical protein CONCODRAFT_78935 [Conidiobolus coronatus NRRL 28638]
MSTRGHHRQNGGYSNRGGRSNFRDDKKRSYDGGNHYQNKRTQQRNNFNSGPSNKAFEENHQRNMNNYHHHNHNHHHNNHFKNKESSGGHNHNHNNNNNNNNMHFKEHSAPGGGQFQNAQPHNYHPGGPQKNQAQQHYNSRNNFNSFNTGYNFNPYQVDLIGVDWMQPIPAEKLEYLDNESRIRMNVALQKISEAPSIFYRAHQSLNCPLIPFLPTIDNRAMHPKDPKTHVQMEKLRDSIINARV